MVARQVDAQRGALADFGVDANLAARLLDEAVDHRQAEPGALADRLGGEERLEGTRDDGGRHAGAGIAHAQRQVFARGHVVLARGPFVERQVCRCHRDAPAGRHGIACIDTQVEQRIFKLRRIDQHGPGVAGSDYLKWRGRADGALDQLLHVGDQAVDIRGLGGERLLARKCQQPVGQGRGASRRPLGGGDVFLEIGEAALLQPQSHQLQGAGNTGQQIVEIVRQAAGQLPDRFHLLALAQGALRRFQLGRALLVAREIAADRVDQAIVPAGGP